MIKFITLVLLLSSCVTSPDFDEAEVYERAKKYDSTPEWADTKTFWKSGGYVHFANIVQMEGTARVSACLSASTVKARGSLLDHIQTAMSKSGTFAEYEGSSEFESLTSFFSAHKIHSTEIIDKYYEKRLVSNAEGQRVPQLLCATQIRIKKSALQKQIRAAVKPKGNKLKEKLLKAQERFIDGLGNDETIAH